MSCASTVPYFDKLSKSLEWGWAFFFFRNLAAKKEKVRALTRFSRSGSCAIKGENLAGEKAGKTLVLLMSRGHDRCPYAFKVPGSPPWCEDTNYGVGKFPVLGMAALLLGHLTACLYFSPLSRGSVFQTSASTPLQHSSIHWPLFWAFVWFCPIEWKIVCSRSSNLNFPSGGKFKFHVYEIWDDYCSWHKMGERSLFFVRTKILTFSLYVCGFFLKYGPVSYWTQISAPSNFFFSKLPFPLIMEWLSENKMIWNHWHSLKETPHIVLKAVHEIWYKSRL